MRDEGQVPVRLSAGHEAGETSQVDWRLLEQRLGTMPQMQHAGKLMASAPLRPQPPPVDKPVTYGRRKTDRVKVEPYAISTPTTPTRVHAVPVRKVLLVMLGLIAAFAIGYLAGRV